MSIEPIIARLIGQADRGDAAPQPPSPAERHALSQRLRELVDADTAERGPPAPDRGVAEEALLFAAYLDGAMTAEQRADYERELAGSSARRAELIAAAAWLDEIEANKDMPPAELTARVLALDDAHRPIATRRLGLAGFLERLFPAPRLALVTSAIASIAIVAVGVDIALHMNPYLSRPAPAIAPDKPSSPQADRPWADASARQPQLEARPPRFALPPGQMELNVSKEVIDAVLGYYGDPSLQRRQELLAALARAGLTPRDAGRVQQITVQPRLYESLKASARTPLRISANLSPAGELVLSD